MESILYTGDEKLTARVMDAMIKANLLNPNRKDFNYTGNELGCALMEAGLQQEQMEYRYDPNNLAEITAVLIHTIYGPDAFDRLESPQEAVKTATKTVNVVNVGGKNWPVDEDGKTILAFAMDDVTTVRMNSLIEKSESESIQELIKKSFRLYEWFKEQISDKEVLVIENLDGEVQFKIPARVFHVLDL